MTGGLGALFLRTASGGDRARRIQAAIVSGAAMTTLPCESCAQQRVHLLAAVAGTDWTRVTCNGCEHSEDWREDVVR